MENFNIHEWQAKYLREDSSTKQTAVEWLLNQLYTRIPNIEWSNYEDDIEQAKEMEKEQIFDALEEFVDITIPPAAKEEYYQDRYK